MISDDGNLGSGKSIEVSGTTALVAGNSYYAVGVFPANGNAYVYLNGSLEGSNSDAGVTSIYNTSHPVEIGRSYHGPTSGYSRHNGLIDEVRISNTARSADWIATSYNNQNDPASYETVGSESAAAQPE